MTKILVAGGGAAGMTAAIFAAERGGRVHLFEKNEKLGKKLFITGKGRCNFTNDCPEEVFFSNIVSNPKFLYSSLYGFNCQSAVEFFEKLGVRTKVERGNRAFPASDHSSDIIRALERRLRELDVKIHLRTEVADVLCRNGKAAGLILKDGTEIEGDAVLIASGGLSYPSTGSTGDGFRWAEACGHSVSPLRPALVPLEAEEEYIPRMQGLSLRNVEFTVKDGKKKLFSEFGELLFTHFGISGPLALSASSRIGKRLEQKKLSAWIDLKPALTPEQLDARLLREFEKSWNRQFKNILPELFPAKLVPVILKLSGISGELPAREITREQREKFAGLTKAFPLTITGTRGYREAVITQGGVSVKEVDPSTMESKKMPGLYFAGEVLDTDALTGGFNLQIAWSTARAAGENMAEKKKQQEADNEFSDCD